MLQYITPKQAITAIAGKLANLRAGRLTTGVIRWFVKRYKVNMSEAAQPNIDSYATFNDFFTRPLAVGVRKFADSDWICPVDGAISQFGQIKSDQVFQAKGHQYSTSTLLAGNTTLAKKFDNGNFATLYLSPKDYHRIHMPCDGRIKSMTYVPGDLFSVNPATAEGIPGLFARNERVVCEFESKSGTYIMVLVGATIVGSMATIWHGIVNPPRYGSIKTWNYTDNISLSKGDEMGCFMLGSTVVMLFEPNMIEFNPEWLAQKPIRLGEIMGNCPS